MYSNLELAFVAFVACALALILFGILLHVRKMENELFAWKRAHAKAREDARRAELMRNMRSA